MQRLIKIGNVKPKHSKNIQNSRIGLGMEKLDRDSFDPSRVYDKVAELGVKWVRLQSGWKKTEQEKGIYNFAWLDEQVDNLIERGLIPWICLCYGNGLYDEVAKKSFGAVGCPPIRTQEAFDAWKCYCKELVEHFKNRVTYFEIWNEPEGKHCWLPEADPHEYALLAKETAKVIKEANPTAKVLAGSHFMRSMEALYVECTDGMLENVDAITYHEYTYDESAIYQRVKSIQAVCDMFKPGIEIIQGESGSPTKPSDSGEFKDMKTDEATQAKQMLRHTIADILSNVKFTSIFSCVDMQEMWGAEAGAKVTKAGYYGMLSAVIDSETGTAVGAYSEKPSYFALQNMCAVLDEEIELFELPVLFLPQKSEILGAWDCKDATISFGGVKKENGAKALIYWNATDLMTIKGFESTVSIQTAGMDEKVVLIDLMDGSVYELPDCIFKNKGNGIFEFKNLPIKDYPMVLAFGDFLSE